MADSLFSAAVSAGRSKGEYKGSMYDVASFDTKKKYSSLIAEEELYQFNQKIDTLSTAINIASKAYGAYQGTASDIKTIEGVKGDMTNKEGLELTKGQRIWETAKLSAGVGEATFGESTISARNIPIQSNLFQYEDMSTDSMFEEASIVSYESALQNRSKYQDLLNKFHLGGDMSQSAWEALQ
tara:strand:- start:14673 stop:15221 length:549 start_codon:yes stop_codon:yes gene_type:complete